MFLDSLFFILIIALFIIIIISISMYGRIRIRTYYSSDKSIGEPISYNAANGGYYTLVIGSDQLNFIPLQEDKNKTINGRLVLLTYSTNSEKFYKVKVMNGNSQVSEGIYSINKHMSYTSINFKAQANDSRTLSIQIQEYNPKTQKFITGEPVGINLVQAYGWYY